jgi:hypothetical protein
MQVKTNVKAGWVIHFNHNGAQVRAAARGLKVQTGVKAGGINPQHNEAQVRAAARGLKVQTNVKAGGVNLQHNEAQVRAAARGLKVQTGLKAGVPVRGTVHVNIRR